MKDTLTKEEQWVLEEKYGQKEITDVNPHFEEDRRRLAEGEPIAYVIGWQPFLGLKIYLDSHPLIPRPETEWWVNELLTKFGHRMSELRFLDVCAGSGAIGCAALKHLPRAEVYFGEIDPAHEATIRKNIAENGLDAVHAHIGIGNLFEPFPDTKFDVIACNPPYVPQGRALPESVEGYESALALRAGEDGLDFIRRIARELPQHLAKDGVAWIECDSEHAEEARDLFEAAGMRTELMHDQYGVPRVLVVHPALTEIG